MNGNERGRGRDSGVGIMRQVLRVAGTGMLGMVGLAVGCGETPAKNNLLASSDAASETGGTASAILDTGAPDEDGATMDASQVRDGSQRDDTDGPTASAFEGGNPDARSGPPSEGGNTDGPTASPFGIHDGASMDVSSVDLDGSDSEETSPKVDRDACSTPAGVADPDWPEWPIPNSSIDVSAGAPNPESYTDNGDGTVTDNVTGLMWQQKVSTNAPWAEAKSYCATLIVGGHCHWRLPNLVELESMMDYARDGGPSILGAYFPEAWSSVFWTSSPMANTPSSAWYVNTYDGSPGTHPITDGSYIRCVQAPTPVVPLPFRYSVASGTVYDQRSKLTWQDSIPSATYTWADAKPYCSGLSATLGGTLWRLPTVKELLSIVDVTRSTPSIDTTAFSVTWSDFFWSSTTYAASTTVNPWVVSFDKGDVNIANTSDMQHLRCVR